MSGRYQRPREYCGEKNPYSPRHGATCVLGKTEHKVHKDLSGMQWTADGPVEKADNR